MKNIVKANLWVLVATAVTMVFICVWWSAETHFYNAIDAAVKCGGSDSEIDGVMRNYGFNLNEWKGETPSLTQKLSALFN